MRILLTAAACVHCTKKAQAELWFMPVSVVRFATALLRRDCEAYMLCILAGHRRHPGRRVKHDGVWWSKCRFCQRPMLKEWGDRRWRVTKPLDGPSPWMPPPRELDPQTSRSPPV